MWCDLVWYGVAWSSVVCLGLVWGDEVWCGVVQQYDGYSIQFTVLSFELIIDNDV